MVIMQMLSVFKRCPPPSSGQQALLWHT